MKYVGWIKRAFTPPLIRRVRRDRLTLVPLDRLLRLNRAADAALRGERGDVLEFGVALGGSSILLATKARKRGLRFAGFDVFETHPPPTSTFDDEKARARFDVIASGRAEGIDGDVYYGYVPDLLQTVTRSFERYGIPVDGRDVMLVKGLFEDTWPSFRSDKVAFAHVDCGWHDPVLYVLESLAPLMTKTGVIVVNAYHDFAGCRDAVEQFLAAHKEFTMERGPNQIIRRS
jgi:O-methyltransferase